MDDYIFIDDGDIRDILDALGSFEKVVNREMRRQSEYIAEEIMVPAFRSAISNHAPGYARKLNQSIRTKQDRIPSVRIGNSNRFSTRGNLNRTGTGVYSGGATTNMIRFGTIQGQYTARSGRTQFWAEGIRPGWTDTAESDYYEPAFAEWTKQANKLINDWNRGADY